MSERGEDGKTSKDGFHERQFIALCFDSIFGGIAMGITGDLGLELCAPRPDGVISKECH